jgi:hypothetical protein
VSNTAQQVGTTPSEHSPPVSPVSPATPDAHQVRSTRRDARLVECGEVAAELDWPQGGVICVRLTCAGVDCSIDTKAVRDALRVADRSVQPLAAAGSHSKRTVVAARFACAASARSASRGCAWHRGLGAASCHERPPLGRSARAGSCAVRSGARACALPKPWRWQRTRAGFSARGRARPRALRRVEAADTAEAAAAAATTAVIAAAESSALQWWWYTALLAARIRPARTVCWCVRRVEASTARALVLPSRYAFKLVAPGARGIRWCLRWDYIVSFRRRLKAYIALHKRRQKVCLPLRADARLTQRLSIVRRPAQVPWLPPLDATEKESLRALDVKHSLEEACVLARARSRRHRVD